MNDKPLAADIAKDLVSISNGERSIWFENLPTNEIFPLARRGVYQTTQESSFARNALYLIEAMSHLGQNGWSCFKAVEKAGRSVASSTPISRLLDKALVAAVMANGSCPGKHLQLMLEVAKNQPLRMHSLLRDFDEFWKPRMGYNWLAPIAQRMSQGKAPIQSWVMLAILLASEDRTESVQKGSLPYDKDILIAKSIFSAMKGAELSDDARMAIDAIRSCSKSSPAVRAYFSYLSSCELALSDLPELSLSREGMALEKSLMSEKGALEMLVKICIHTVFKTMLRESIRESGYAIKSIELINDLGAALSRPQFDDLLVSAMISQIGKANMSVAERIGIERMHELSKLYASIAGNWHACLWAILSDKRSSSDYLRSGKPGTALLRKAIEVIENDLASKSMKGLIAKVALIETYSEKQIGLIMHNKKDSGETLKKVYEVVGDRFILQKMDGQSRKSTLMSEMDL